MTDDRINLWLLLIPDVDEILLCRPTEEIVKGIEKTGIKFMVVYSTKDLKISKKFGAVCFWNEDTEEEWLYYISKILKPGGTCIILPVCKHKNKIVNMLNKLDLRLNEKYIILPRKDDPRWLIPESSTVIMSRALDIYQPYLHIAKLAKTVVAIGLKYGIGKSLWGKNQIWVIYKGKAENINNIKHLVSDYFREKVFLSASSGTISPHRKITVQVMNYEGRVLGFMKIGSTELAKIQIEKEFNTLRYLKDLHLESIHIPKVLKLWNTNHGKLLFLSPPDEDFRAGPITMGSVHYAFLNEFYKKTLRYYSLEEHPAWLRVSTRVEKINWTKAKYDKKIIYKIISKIRETLDGRKIPAVRIHGDYAPWNTRVKGDNLFVFDWEYSESDGLPFYDIVYWNLQVMLLLKKKSGSEIFQELEIETRGNIAPKISDRSRKAYCLWSLVDIFTQRIGGTETNSEYLKKIFDTCNIIVKKF